MCRPAADDIVVALLVTQEQFDFAGRAAPDDFLGWPVLLEVTPADDTRPRRRGTGGGRADDGADRLSGLRVLAQSDHAEQLPGGDEIAPGLCRAVAERRQLGPRPDQG